MGRYDWQVVLGTIAFVGGVVTIAFGTATIVVVAIMEFWFG